MIKTSLQAHAMDPLHIHHMDIYAYLLAKEKKTVELQRYVSKKIFEPHHEKTCFLHMQNKGTNELSGNHAAD